MTRVLLFADFGKGPKQVARFHTLSANRERRELFTFGGLTYWAPAGALGFYRKVMTDARRWWLVECKSAAAVRELIRILDMERRAANTYGAPHGIDHAHLGRILDSGGKGATP